MADARSLIDRALAADGGQVSIWLNKAGLLRAEGQVRSAIDAVDAALRIDPRAFLALLMRASLLERMGRLREAGPAYGVALLQAPPEGQLDPATQKATAHARAVNAAYARDLGAHLQGRLAGFGAAASADARRAAAFIDLLCGTRRIYRQEPVGYFYPGQPAIEFWERSEFPWLEAFEASAPAIIAELRAWAEGSDEALVPYLDHPDTGPLDQWAELNRSRRWSALHLYNFGDRVEENCHRFPRTMEALARLPQPKAGNRSPSAMFSVLEPRTHIPPHTGIANTRLVVHLPLVIPPDCRFRVGNETRTWRTGEAWVFDDTIEHEAWNDSDRRRIILICDIWSPRLSSDERAMIAAIMEAMDEFNGVPPGSAQGGL